MFSYALQFLLAATRGYRLRPWRSPYLRWRMETYSGIPAEQIGFGEFWSFIWRERWELWRLLRWGAEMQRLEEARRAAAPPARP